MIEKHRFTTRRQHLHAAGLAALSLLAAGLMSCGEKEVETAKGSIIKCANCPMRARYDRDPKSFAGRAWKWHISWCPGWKDYLNSLPGEERARIMEKYK